MALDDFSARAVHLDLDGAWPADVCGLPRLDARSWGPRLRYIARRTDIEAFWREFGGKLPPFVLYGSGDFHHLAGVMIRRVRQDSFTLVSFDNHPDWDIRPPYWSCGGWAARALRNPAVQRVSVWGCGNFELQWPARLFADRRALRNKTLEVHAWAERQSEAVSRRFNCMTRDNWRDRFINFTNALRGTNVYITVDLDCLCKDEAVTNWENGLFSAQDVAWAIGQLKEVARIVGTDLCGAYSEPQYEGLGQRFAGWWDHPKRATPDVAAAQAVNLRSMNLIWNELTQLK